MDKTKDNKENSLFINFKYITVGTGIIGIGFLVALLGYLFLR